MSSFLKFSRTKILCELSCFRVLANPEVAPKIDWAAYKSKIPIAGLVDTFQKGYEGLSIPYPTENVSSQIDAQAQEVNNELQALSKKTNEEVSRIKEEIARVSGLIAYSQMTMEEYYIAHPEEAIDTYKNPTYWPHGPENQPGYVHPDGAEESSH